MRNRKRPTARKAISRRTSPRKTISRKPTSRSTASPKSTSPKTASRKTLSPKAASRKTISPKTASRKIAPRKAARGSAKRVDCRRVTRTRRIEEHLDCPYCYGKAEDVAKGKHRDFCDYEPGKDPIVYGFPEKSSRIQQG